MRRSAAAALTGRSSDLLRLGTPRRRIRLLALGLATAAVLAVSGSPAAAAVAPSGFFGVGGWSYPTDAQSASLGAAGLGLVRGALGWGVVQPSPNPASRNWSDPDRLARDAARNGYNLIIDLNGCAVWACGTVNAPPTGAALSEYENFVSAAAARYAPTSSFWAGLPRVPTVSWQVWNEVNGGYFWPDPTPAAYAAFLAQIGSTIMAVDPTATVVMSGLVDQPGVSGGMPLTTFLQGLYQQPGFPADTAAIAVHGYASSPAASLHILDEGRSVMLQNGDGARPMWVTEMSWGAGGPALANTVSLATQSTYLVETWDEMLACRQRWNLQHVLWFPLQDISSAQVDEPDNYTFYYGLLNEDGSPKPVYSSFLQFIGSAPLPDGAGDQCTLPGGLTVDTTDPHTQIISAPYDTNDTRSVMVSFTATENGQSVPGMSFQCSLDEAPWKSCTSPMNVASSREGDHSLLVRGIDPQGNVDPTPASAGWLVDLTPPATVITSVSRASSDSRIARVSFVGVDAGGMGSFQCQLDGRVWHRCASPFATQPLKPGKHVLAVRAVDRAGNIDPTPARVVIVVLRARGARHAGPVQRHLDST